MTDEELLHEVNDCLDDEEKHISKRTFERYKQKSLSIADNEEDLPQKDHELLQMANQNAWHQIM